MERPRFVGGSTGVDADGSGLLLSVFRTGDYLKLNGFVFGDGEGGLEGEFGEVGVVGVVSGVEG
ncbi:hypothetical protein, partial [Streptomyces sp. NPDC058595]|uniref:hypothetical protein n=1 Tax=Streptomyces sp. NPDC058595 TaxID=3346550 RepID=UPI00364930DC